MSASTLGFYSDSIQLAFPTSLATAILVCFTARASINNIGVILFRDSFITNYFKDKPDYIFNAQQLSFLIGVTYIGAYTAYDALTRKTQIRSSIKRNVTSCYTSQRIS